MIANAKQRGGRLAVLYLDLDRFKSINDTLGHSAGDHFLRAFAERITVCLRNTDFVAYGAGTEPPAQIARLGGDEFTVVLGDIAGDSHVAKVAQRILDSMAQPVVINGEEVFASASIGIALYPSDGDEVEILLKRADMAMYQAKMRGKATYEYYASAIDSRATARLSLESKLRRALEREELLLYYQPQVDTRSGTITAAEALLRWQLPDQALIAPAEFISLAEETGLIVPIGEWALHSACAQAQAWQQAGYPLIRIAVNLSRRQLQHRDFLQMVTKVLADTGLPPRHLELELTEESVIDKLKESVALLHALKERGVTLAMDDFGTGYSSLSYLRHMPVDSLKIDRSFVRDIGADPDDAAIITAIIAMAQSLALRIVAEGVETAEQLEFLKNRGCHEIQGYYFSRPLPAIEFARLLSVKAAKWPARVVEIRPSQMVNRH
jgi:diguanylate cyclase (GGDEF)-like protein